jgi:tetratricopeptide (TPR) repeat protein
VLLGLALPVILPLLLLAGAEGGLRLAGYGYSTRPFIQRSCGGGTVHIRNKAFLEQFFSEPIQQFIWEWPQFAVPADKPAGACRIFVFGSSAAMGWPNYEFSFPRLLEAMLESAYPEVRFEVYNAAFAGVNSHAMRVTALACAKLQPDLFLVYMGNNEVHGPFGLRSAFHNMPDPPNLAAIRAKIWSGDFRLVQWLSRWRSGASPSDPAKPDTEPLRPDDPRLAEIYARFRANLDDIFAAGHGIPVLVSTVGANLRQWPPSASWNREGLPADPLSAWWRLYQEGLRLQADSGAAAALPVYQQAAKIDDFHAELHFRMGQCLWQTGDYPAAYREFVRAMDLDSFDWVRAKTPINDTIREVAQAHRDRGVRLVPGAEALAARGEHGTPGMDLFVDSCHLNLDGSYVLACAFFDEIVKALPERFRGPGEVVPRPIPLDECQRALALTPAKLIEPLRQIIKAHNALGQEPQSALETQAETIEKQIPKDSAEQYLSSLRQAALSGRGDYHIQCEYAEKLVYQGAWDEAIQQARTTAEAYPCRRGSRRILGDALRRAGRYDEAIAELRQVAALYPDDAETYALWGDALREQGQAAESLDLYRQSLTWDKNNPRAQCGMIDLEAARNPALDARTRYLDVIERNPWFYEAYQRVSALYRATGDLDGLVTEWQRLTDKHPDWPLAQYSLALAFEARGDIEAAIAAFQSAHRLDPLSWITATGLGRALTRQGRARQQAGDLDGAREAFHEARSYAPEMSEAWQGEIDVLRQQARDDEADKVCREAQEAKDRKGPGSGV